MTKAELIEALKDFPDDTEVYVYGDFAGGQLDYSPIENVCLRNREPHYVGVMGPDNIIHSTLAGFKGIMIIPMDD